MKQLQTCLAMVIMVYIVYGQIIHSVDRVHKAIQLLEELPEAVQKYVNEERKKLDELEQ